MKDGPIEKNGMIWNGLRWKRKDEGPDEDESYEKPFLLQEPGISEISHPLDKHPDWPYVSDPEIEAMEYDDPFKEEDEPLVFEDMRVDPTKEDATYLQPWIRKNVPPPTAASIREGEELLRPPCYMDDDPKNLWLYKEYHGPIINTIVRQEWGAEGWKPKKPLNIPVKHVRFTYTNGPTKDLPEALGILTEMQKQHRAEGLEDIAYNHVIGRDGAIYEGRGWYVDAERPEKFNYLKGDCLDIAYLGKFDDCDPPWVLLRSAMDIIRYAIEIRVLDPNFKVIQYRDHQ